MRPFPLPANHLNEVISKCNNFLNPLKLLKVTIRSKHLERMYLYFILPHMDYGSVISDCANQSLLSTLDQIHY
jgi:hypothetical protein